ncbi:MAG: aldehyde ferredoxin oxidoreductase family protein [Thermovenabulum sp.]|uniref:aldehyde ferredoxin oxidoreductase family protein n=1 Tax=Thermovenabulum sp. TaxID=3100335 RepID=UPI003C7DA2C8
MFGYYGKIINVNLSIKKIEIQDFPEELQKKYIGGSGVGARILYDETGPDTDPLSGDNPLILMTGPFVGTRIPTSGRHQIITKSPLTGIYGEGDVGGSFGATLKTCGYDGIVIKGCSEKPVYILITQGEIHIKDAGEIWGKDTYETEKYFKSKYGKNVAVGCIGLAGENLVPIANIIFDGKHARAGGRGGLGAVMGSKKLKAIAIIKGNSTVDVYDSKGLLDSIKRNSRIIIEKTKSLAQFGTAGGVVGSEMIGDLPLKNWAEGSWPEGAQKISGQRMAETILTGRYFCKGCIIGCGREVAVKEGKYAGVEGAGPEYETLGMLGGCCLIDDLDAIAYANELCNRYGLDTISTGGVIAFAMEAAEKGIIKEEEIPIKWGNPGTLISLIHKIAKKEGIGEILGKGVKEAAKIFGKGAEEFAIHSKGLEFPAHDPRAYNSLALGYATSNRGACHLQGATYFFEKSVIAPELGFAEVQDRLDKERKAELNVKAQNLMSLLDSLKLCKFILYGGMTPNVIVEWLNLVTGWDITLDEFMKIGERIFNLKRLYNTRLGIRREHDTIPKRILTLKRGGGTKDNLPNLEEMLEEYYKIRGWNEQGIPTEEKLKELGL